MITHSGSHFSTSRHSQFAPGNGPDDEKRLRARRNGVGQWGVWRLVGQILLAVEEAQEQSALVRDVVADRPRHLRLQAVVLVPKLPFGNVLPGNSVSFECHTSE